MLEPLEILTRAGPRIVTPDDSADVNGVKVVAVDNRRGVMDPPRVVLQGTKSFVSAPGFRVMSPAALGRMAKIG
jgi:hypothetical protein